MDSSTNLASTGLPTQKKDIMDVKDVFELRSQGRLEEAYVAIPGTSEHELGLAVDINEAGGADPWGLYNWLAAHAHEYGFILRYPQGKESITGIDYEPWHFRYVGKEAAAEIYSRQVTLEEYLQN